MDSEIPAGSVISGKFGSYRIHKIVGRGSYGHVAQCIDTCTDKIVMIKFSNSEKKKWASMNEAHHLQNLSENCDKINVIKMYKSFNYEHYHCLVLESLDTSLADYLRKNGSKPFSLSEIQKVTTQLLVSLKALADRRLIHADVHPFNILFVDHKEQPFRIKLIDFGMADEYFIFPQGKIFQNPGFRAPEIYIGGKIDEAIDMWSLGCTLAFMYRGKCLFHPKCEYQALKTIMQLCGYPDEEQFKQAHCTKRFFINDKGTYRLYTSEEYSKIASTPVSKCTNKSSLFTSLEDMAAFHPKPKSEEEQTLQSHFFDLLHQLLQINPTKRITAAKALCHPFIASPPPPPEKSFKQHGSLPSPSSDSVKAAPSDSCVPESKVQVDPKRTTMNKLELKTKKQEVTKEQSLLNSKLSKSEIKSAPKQKESAKRMEVENKTPKSSRSPRVKVAPSDSCDPESKVQVDPKQTTMNTLELKTKKQEVTKEQSLLNSKLSKSEIKSAPKQKESAKRMEVENKTSKSSRSPREKVAASDSCDPESKMQVDPERTTTDTL